MTEKEKKPMENKLSNKEDLLAALLLLSILSNIILVAYFSGFFDFLITL